MKTWKDIPELKDKNALEALIETEKTPLQIAKHLECSRESVKHAMRHHGLHTKKFQIKEDMKKRLRL